jgi:hypothetical protein
LPRAAPRLRVFREAIGLSTATIVTAARSLARDLDRLVAQGIGHRYDYVPVRLSTARFPAAPAQLGTTLPAQARAAVVLGNFDSLGAYLQGLGAPTDSGPVVAIRTLPEDPTRFVVILAAATEAELPIAATAFAMQRMPWPGKAWVAVRDLQLPPPKDLREAADVQDASTHAQPFSALGYATTTYSGLPTGNASLRFWNSNWQGRMQVRLHLAYGSGITVPGAGKATGADFNQASTASRVSASAETRPDWLSNIPATRPRTVRCFIISPPDFLFGV